jgi:hypothetical protein
MHLLAMLTPKHTLPGPLPDLDEVLGHPSVVRIAITPSRGLGLTVAILEDLLVAVADRQDVAGPDERARLGRARSALELELADRLAA